MALGGFKRAVKVVDGKVVDHRPVGHEDAKDWVVVNVPVDIPFHINDMMRDELLELKDGKLSWPDGCKLQPIEQPVSDVAVILEALKTKGLITDEDITTAKAAVKSKRETSK